MSTPLEVARQLLPLVGSHGTVNECKFAGQVTGVTGQHHEGDRWYFDSIMGIVSTNSKADPPQTIIVFKHKHAPLLWINLDLTSEDARMPDGSCPSQFDANDIVQSKNVEASLFTYISNSTASDSKVDLVKIDKASLVLHH